MQGGRVRVCEASRLAGVKAEGVGVGVSVCGCEMRRGLSKIMARWWNACVWTWTVNGPHQHPCLSILRYKPAGLFLFLMRAPAQHSTLVDLRERIRRRRMVSKLNRGEVRRRRQTGREYIYCCDAGKQQPWKQQQVPPQGHPDSAGALERLAP
jgi:hypothetical protein